MTGKSIMARKKLKNFDTLTQFTMLVESIVVTAQSKNQKENEFTFTKAWVMKELFCNRYYATKLIDICLGLGLLHKVSNRYSISVENYFFMNLNDVQRNY